jgi:hypothetical protein
MSWTLHNIIAWTKNKPFLSTLASRVYIVTITLAQPYWVLEIYANFAYFQNQNDLFLKTRPLEPLFRWDWHRRTWEWGEHRWLTHDEFRDPWWIFTACSLLYEIKKSYELKVLDLVRVSPRFGLMLISMTLSIFFIIVDTCSVLNLFPTSLPTGIEPFWKVSERVITLLISLPWN